MSYNDIGNMTTDHEACAMLVDVLVGQGLKYAVISPGSRNAPLIVAFSREERIRKWIVVDERSAAFVAVGIAQQTESPVAVVCTSGSAVLNYAPAASEAYYRHLPLLFISADRQAEWIDQNDSQTIRQSGALANVVKRTFDIPAVVATDNRLWWINRMANEAAILARRVPMGPVHVNVQLGEPLCGLAERGAGMARIIDDCEVRRTLGKDAARHYATMIAQSRRVMIVAGMGQGDERLGGALARIARLPNVVVLTETIANLADERFIPTIDRTISAIPDAEKPDFAPQLLVLFGGSLVTRMLKQFLRSYPAAEQWRIGVENGIIDTMQHLTRNFDMEPADFFAEIAGELESIAYGDVGSDYAARWKNIEAVAAGRHAKYVDCAPWSDLKAFSVLLPRIPAAVRLHLSNGTPIRYAQLFDCPNIACSYCNRGVAGIDGTTSTALGASLVSRSETTLLVTGDMSLSYDLNGMSSQYNSERFKIVVMCNGGGGIFRFINGPSELPELERYFEVSRDLPVRQYAAAFGFDYYEASDERQLADVLGSFFANDKASILAIRTPAEQNAVILRSYFASLRE